MHVGRLEMLTKIKALLAKLPVEVQAKVCEGTKGKCVCVKVCLKA